MSGKGSNPRPFSVDQKTFANNWDAIFKKDSTMSETEKTGTCGFILGMKTNGIEFMVTHDGNCIP
jgi:hypothetical protein